MVRGKEMAKPAAYSESDPKDRRAINTLERILNFKQITPYLKAGDKTPNYDGYLELLHEDGTPLGEIRVQVKTIKENRKKYSCKSKYVAYSEVCMLPFLLICVDVENNRAYWKQLTPTMPEYKEGQKNFTIHFNDSTDLIDEGEYYRQKWIQMIEEYQLRISSFPELKKEVDFNMALKGIDRRDVANLQTFIATVNNELDTTFIGIKNAMFPGVWMLGVGLFSINELFANFQIYRIPHGENAPLVCRIEGDSLNIDSPNAIHANAVRRQMLEDSEDAGKRLVYDYVRQAVENRLLGIHSELCARETVIHFLEDYSKCLGLESAATYNLEEIEAGMGSHLIGIANTLADRLTSVRDGEVVVVDLEEVARILNREDVKPTAYAKRKTDFIIYSSKQSIKAVLEALKLLRALGINEVEGILRPRTYPLGTGGNWIWSGYSEEDEKHNARVILQNSITEYSKFVSGNKLNFEDSFYLGEQYSVVFHYSKRRDVWGGVPVINELIIDSKNKELPKVEVAFEGDERIRVSNWLPTEIEVEGKEYDIIVGRGHDPGLIFKKTPMADLVYEMLWRDLEYNYGIKSGMFEYDFLL